MDNNFYSNTVQSKIENKETEKQRVVDELVSFGKKTGNPFHFVDLGGELGKDFTTKENVINQSILLGLDEDGEDTLKKSLEILKIYYNGPVFTDDFGKNHRNLELPDVPSRYNWERENLNKLSQKAKEYYKDNKLNFGSRISPVVSCLYMIKDTLKNPLIKKKIEELLEKSFNLKEEGKPSFLEQLVKDGGLSYSLYSNDEKIQSINRLNEIVRQVIFFLEQKT